MIVKQKYRKCVLCENTGGDFYARRLNNHVYVTPRCIVCHREAERIKAYERMLKDLKKHNLKHKEYRDKNKEKYNALKLKEYHKNKHERAKSMRQYYLKHREEILAQKTEQRKREKKVSKEYTYVVPSKDHPWNLMETKRINDCVNKGGLYVTRR